MEKLIKLNIKGKLLIKKYKGGKLVEEINLTNAIQDTAKDILRHVLAGDNTYKLNYVKALKSSLLLADASITVVSYNPIYNNKFTLTAIFDEASFNDTLDELQLTDISGNIFSQVTGLSITKDNLTKLSIEWTLIIEIN